MITQSYRRLPRSGRALVLTKHDADDRYTASHQVSQDRFASFPARRTADLEDKIREVALEPIGVFLEKGSTDCHAGSAASFPVKFIHFALNMAPETEDCIKVWSDAAVAASGANIIDERCLEAAREQSERQKCVFSEYENRLVEPQDDILSALAHAYFDDPRTPEDETHEVEFVEYVGAHYR